MCYKGRKSNIKIGENEGFGDMPWGPGDPLEFQKCRHNFPKFPVPETTILRKFESGELEDTELKETNENLKQNKKNYFAEDI